MCHPLPNALFAFSPLNRLKKLTDALNGVSELSYDALDQLTGVKDPLALSTSYGIDGFGNLKTQTSPDTGSTTNTFDAAGNLLTSTNARAHKTTYSYDALNRVTQIKYHDNRTVLFTYDDTASGNYGKGRLTQITDAAQHGNTGNTRFTYDQAGRLTQKTQTVGSVVLSTQYSYDSVGRVSSQTLPSGKLIHYGYNSAGQIRTLSIDSTAYLSNITYTPFGPVQSWFGQGNSAYSRSFDADGRLSSYPLGNQSVVLSYDRQGRLTNQSGAHAGRYTYDALDRLTEAERNSQTERWSFDANGNRLSRQLEHDTTTVTDTYSLSASNGQTSSNRLSSITGTLNRSYQHDAAGNTLNDGQRSYTYDTANRLTHIVNGSVTQTHTYNGLGQRVKKTVTQNGSSTHTHYVYDEAGQLLGEYNAGGSLINETVYLGNMPVLLIRQGGIFNIQTDQLSTPRAILNSSKVVVWKWDSDQFGATQPDQDPDGNGLSLQFNLRFPGQVFDPETELHYNYWCTLDPSTGRYLESDPIGLKGGTNTYGYALQNPVAFKDPSGLFVPGHHRRMTREAAKMAGCKLAGKLAEAVVDIDKEEEYPGTQGTDAEHSAWHHMSGIGEDGQYVSPEEAERLHRNVVAESLASCEFERLALAIHATQDGYSPAHRDYQQWHGMGGFVSMLSLIPHGMQDTFVNPSTYRAARNATRDLIQAAMATCPMICENGCSSQ